MLLTRNYRHGANHCCVFRFVICTLLRPSASSWSRQFVCMITGNNTMRDMVSETANAVKMPARAWPRLSTPAACITRRYARVPAINPTACSDSDRRHFYVIAYVLHIIPFIASILNYKQCDFGFRAPSISSLVSVHFVRFLNILLSRLISTPAAV